ncbi:UDP-glucose:undecaprenyl-phosphate glucose-1-phosphate transferase [mine drainage metagenome]|uniref:UDP-glucose:undecaprenyl-phosphate glucose-1-phosphate transferase n=1 Tax=mine drainage metagenome TaxID=410659 RepID=A0A1J5QUW4_9ZZZZ
MTVRIDAARAFARDPVAAKRVGVATTSGWAARYARRLWLSDAVAVAVAVSVAYVVRFDVDGFPRVSGRFSPSYLAVSVVLMAAWLAILAGGHSRDRRLVGTGPEEYARVFGLTWRLFAGVAIVAYLMQMQIGRGFIAIAAPLGLALLLLERFWWRQWLHGRRMDGDYKSGILVIGHRGKALGLIETFHRNPRAGYGVVGVCVPSGEVDLTETVGGVAIVGPIEDAAEIALRIGADAVAVAGSDVITAEAVRRLGWDLEGTGIDLALAVALTDIAGPRVLMRPVNGLPLMYVDEPRFAGMKFVAKSAFDWVGAVCVTIVLSPILIAVAIAVKTTSRGPVFYSQERVGRDGRHFRMIKFRSMVTGAHERLAEVLALEGIESVGMFYKPKNDPRVTPVGRFIRAHSIDELPQLFNVLRGEMSLVGPRPQIDNEVAQYDRNAHRRLLVKPGMTGLWQVSGRSDLSVVDGIRMDVYYVENWSLFGDVLILARTARAVILPGGAY